MTSLATETIAMLRHRDLREALPFMHKKRTSPCGPAQVSSLLERRERDGVTSERGVHSHVSHGHDQRLAFFAERDHHLRGHLDRAKVGQASLQTLHTYHLLSSPVGWTIGSAGRAGLFSRYWLAAVLYNLEHFVLVVELVKPRLTPTGRAALLVDQGVSDHTRIIKLGGFCKPFCLGECVELNAHFKQRLLGSPFLKGLTFTEHYRESHVVFQFRHMCTTLSSTTDRTNHPTFQLSSINLNSIN